MKKIFFLLLLLGASIYAHTGSFVLPMIGSCDNFVAICNGNAYIVWTNSGYPGSCASNDGMILVAENAVSVSCPGASRGTVCRGPGSNCYGVVGAEDYYYTDCPQACTYTTLDSIPPSSSSEELSSSSSEEESLCRQAVEDAQDILEGMMYECLMDGGSIGGYSIGYSHELGFCVEGGCGFSSSSSDEESSSSSEDLSSSSIEKPSSSSSSGSSSGDSGSGVCQPYPLVSAPANPLSACFETGGKCYKCNPDRGSECGYDWIWNSGFSSGNIGWWYREISCGGDSGSSSSSDNGACQTYPLPSTPANPLSACFETGGKCYRCNPARGSECGYDWIWSSGFSAGNIGWWYEEIGCGGSGSSSSYASSSSERSSSSTDSPSSSSIPGSSGYGVCQSHPLPSVPSNPLSACFSANGKCYRCNPARGSECGSSWLWIYGFNYDSWWHEEVACGGGSNDGGGSNKCSDNSFLQKKSMSGESYENSNEDMSYNVWGSKTQFYYDALGRKTQARPETRRYLFEPKKNAYNKEHSYLQLGTISFKQEITIDGFVEVWHNYSAYGLVEEPENCDCPSIAWTNLKISLSFGTTIGDIEHQNNPLLKIHEDKHIEIYNSLGNAKWEKIVPIDYCKSYEQICSEFKKEVKSEFEKRLIALVAAHNKWDDDDQNNVSDERIDLQEKLNEMYQEVNNFDCPQVK